MTNRATSSDLGRLYLESSESFLAAKGRLVTEIEQILESQIQDHYVVARVKSARSLVRKVREDPINPRAWDSITDKVGARVICSTKADCRRVDALLQNGPWDLIERQVKKGAPDRLFYPGTHLIISSDDLLDHRDERIPCEIQIRTRAQDAWAVISHKLSYKGVIKPPRKMRRLIDRLTVVVEMFDDEVHRLFKKRARLPMYQTAVELERLEDRFEGLTGVPAEAAIDLTLMSMISGAYAEDERNRIDELVGQFCADRADLPRLLAEHSLGSPAYSDSSDWLFTQPEVLAILERAKNKRYLLLNAVQNTDLEGSVRAVCITGGYPLPSD